MKNLLIIVFLLSIFFGFAQKPIYKHYTAEDGLPHDITYGIIQDSNGYIWIGTDDGLSKFNGSTFTNYSYENGLQSNYVIDILETKPNEFYIATWGGGLHHFRRDSIIKVPVQKDENTKINILGLLKNDMIYANSSSPTFSIYDLKNNTKNGFYLKVDPKHDTPIPSKKAPLLYKDSYLSSESIVDRELYVHADENSRSLRTREYPDLIGIYKVNKNSLIPVFPELKNKSIHEVYKKDGVYYFTSFNTIFKYQNFKIVEQKELIDIPDEKITHLKKHNDLLYFITISNVNGTRKLYSYNWENSRLLNISDQLHIESMISDFIFDSQNNLWITTYGEGVYNIPAIGHSFLGDELFSNPDLKDLLFIKNDLYALSTNKIYILDSLHLEEEINFPIHTEAFRYNSADNSLILRTYFEKTTFISKTQKDQVNIIAGTINNASIHHKNLYIAVEFNVVKFYRDHILFASDYTIKPSMNESIRKMVIHNDKLFIINKQIGVLIYDINTGKLIRELSTRTGFITNKVTDITFDKKGSIWIATDRGIFSIDSQKITGYTTKDGLISNHINGLHFDQYNVLWVATQKGLNVMSDNNFYTIDKSIGQGSSFITKITEHNDFIYAAGNKGVFIHDNRFPFIPKQYSSLKINQNNHIFNIFPINYVNAHSLQLQYKINGGNWVKTQQTELDFGLLNQGNHTIIFRYKDNLSDWKRTTPYHFSIIYPWYSQSWFYALIIAVISIIILSIVIKLLQRSIKRNNILNHTIKEREKLRNELNTVRKNVAQDFHDELGNKLASISVLSNLVMQKTDKKTDIHQKIKKIKEDSKFLYSGMRDFIWTLDHESDRLDELQLYLTDFGEQLFNNTEISFLSSSPIDTTNVILPYYWSKQLVFIFKEAMTNCFKHSNATKVNFYCEFKKQELTFILKDNGNGFDMEQLKRQNGLANMKTRAEKIKSKLLINSSQHGTVIIFKGMIY